MSAWKLLLSLMAISISTLGHELVFPWHPGLNGWLLINRTSNWRDSILIERVPFKDQGKHFTNATGVFTIIQFTDPNPSPDEGFYCGIIITNR